MTEFPRTLTLGTRGSALARWQTDYVGRLLHLASPELEIRFEVLTTQGDRVLDTPLPLLGGKGVFTVELEAALRDGSIDLAVHSLKDLPTENSPGLVLGAVPQRSSPDDVLVSKKGLMLDALPQGAKVGTSSRRRAAQLLHRRPDLNIVDIRGNVDTRLRKAFDPNGAYDAIVLAAAGLERLGQVGVITERLSLEDMLPAPGQGALGVQCRADADLIKLLETITHRETQIAVTAERSFLAGLGGGCALPIAAYALIENQQLHLRGRVTAPDGSQQVDVSLQSTPELEAAQRMGAELAQMALKQGAAYLLESVK